MSLRLLRKMRAWRPVLRIGFALLATALILLLAGFAVRNWLAMRALHAGENATAVRVQIADFRRAHFFRPDLSISWRLEAEALAYTHPRRARALALRAAALNPQNWRNWQTLGMIDFQLGDLDSAHAAMRRSARYDAGFSAHFAAANLAFILGDQPGFWRNMRAALRIAPAQDVNAALQDLVHLGGDHPRRLLSVIPPRRTRLQAAAIGFLLQRGQLSAATRLSRQLSCPVYRRRVCRGVALQLASAWLQIAQTGETSSPSNSPRIQPGRRQLSAAVASPIPRVAAAVAQAMAVWNQAVDRQALPSAARVYWGAVTDGDFHTPWWGAFLWQAPGNAPPIMPAPSGSAGAPPAGNAVELAFSGYQPSHALQFWQWLPVRPGTSYVLSAQSLGTHIHHGHGLALAVILPGHAHGALLPLKLQAEWRTDRLRFAVPSGISLLQLQVAYNRPSGHSLLRGKAWLRRIYLHPAISHALPARSNNHARLARQ